MSNQISSNESENSCHIEINQNETKPANPQLTNHNLMDDLSINSPNKPSNKRSLSPNAAQNQMPIKKHKDTDETEEAEEELLDSLPISNASMRVSQPSLAVVKNSIRVNIGCNKK